MVRIVYYILVPIHEQGGNGSSPTVLLPTKENNMDSIIEMFNSLTSDHRHAVLELIETLHTQESPSDDSLTDSEIQI